MVKSQEKEVEPVKGAQGVASELDGAREMGLSERGQEKRVY